MSKNKYIDAVVLGSLIVFAPLLSFVFKTNLLISIFLFYGLPALWLSFRIPGCIKRAAVFSLIGTVMFFVLDYIAVLDGAWWVSTIFKFRILGILPVEDSIWMFLGCYLVVMFYECFDDQGPHQVKKTKLKYLIRVVVLIVSSFLVFLIFYPQFLVIRYAYLWIGIIFSIIPTLVIIGMYPRLLFKLIRTNFYMFSLQLPFEIVALKTDQWSFPGDNFIGWVEFAGVRFPFEEFLIYISMTGIALLAYYEFFDDDGK